MEERKSPTATVDSTEMANGVTFGVRGCLITLVGFVLGAVVGAGVGAWLAVNYPGTNPVKEGGNAFLGLFLTVPLGAAIGLLVGVVIGTKRR